MEYIEVADHEKLKPKCFLKSSSCVFLTRRIYDIVNVDLRLTKDGGSERASERREWSL
jgi:hypothetical protein